MKHLGDITKISGYDAPVVDVVIGGSPCQDLSVAGKREGLAGERSGLFMEQMRIIREMRERDKRTGRTGVHVRPRHMVWENVPGAFTSGKPKGADFAAVLEECIKVVQPQAPPVPVPEKGWPTAGCIYDELGEWSVAWRVLDAQFWGTPDRPLPQRRRRIALVADYGGMSAPEICFVRSRLSGNFEPLKPKGKAAAPGAAGGTDSADRERESAGGDGGRQLAAVGFLRQLGGVEAQQELSPTLMAAAGESGNNKPCVAYTLKVHSGCEVDSNGKAAGKGALVQTDMAGTIAATQDQYLFQPVAGSYILDDQGGSFINVRTDGQSPTLRAQMNGHPPMIVESVAFEPGIAAREGGHIYEGLSGTLRANAGDNKMAVAYAYAIQGSMVCVADHPTPKVDLGGTAYTLNSRDYKNPQVVAMEVKGHE